MPPRFDDLDVFRIPHSRMKQLVNSCNKKLTLTDFANNDALFELLSSLDVVFKEFKSHEEIENEQIMMKLKQKLKEMAIYNSAVCNCHKDDEFTPLFRLVDQGYMHIDKSKTTSERINFGVKLRRALNQFTKRFVPHMREEEEVFQPLLMEHFTKDELIEMKNNVIKMHLQKRKQHTNAANATAMASKVLAPLVIEKSLKRIDAVTTNDLSLSISASSSCSSSSSTPPPSVHSLPNELMLKIFDQLPLEDRLRASKVCMKWYDLVYDSRAWKRLSFTEWRLFHANSAYWFDEYKFDEEAFRNHLNETTALLDAFEYETADESDLIEKKKNFAIDMKILEYWTRDLLPKIGSHLKELDLSNCESINNNTLRHVLRLCPNLTDLSISYTNLGDNSFRNIRLDKLESFNCEGCPNISDNAFKYMLVATIAALSKQHNHARNQTSNQHLFCHDCTDNHSIEDLHAMNRVSLKQANVAANIPNDNEHEAEPEVKSTDSFKRNSLKYINLSGCWSITDFGLKCIASKYDLSNLEYLNLSGCINVSSDGINLFVDMCQTLDGENLYYCDNIDNGPMISTANGCENLECGKKFCCRSTFVQ